MRSKRVWPPWKAAQASAAFGSGSAATMAIFQSLAPGDHVLRQPMRITERRSCCREFFARWGLEATSSTWRTRRGEKRAAAADETALGGNAVESALEDYRSRGAGGDRALSRRTLCLRQHLDADHPATVRSRRRFVMHSTTKYFGGHSDVLGGIIVAKNDGEFFQRVRTIQYDGGAVPSPFDCWLVSARNANAAVADARAFGKRAEASQHFLPDTNVSRTVHYPGLRSHPAHEIAARQMSAFGGMLSFEVRGGLVEAMAIAARTKIFTRATSLGGVESLIEHRASIEGPGTQTPDRFAPPLDWPRASRRFDR